MLLSEPGRDVCDVCCLLDKVDLKTNVVWRQNLQLGEQLKCICVFCNLWKGCCKILGTGFEVLV